MIRVYFLYLSCLIALNRPSAAQPRTFLQAQGSKLFRHQPPPLQPAPLWPGTSAWSLTRDGALWVGTDHGLWRYSRSGWDYFASRRYLPSDKVVAIRPIPSDSHGVEVFTSEGAARLTFLSMTLNRKAHLFETRAQDRHNRHGMVADSILTRPGDLSSNQTVSSDNDGLWTAMFGAAECFRYAVTRSDEARQRAERSVEALLFLEKITGIPGFPARSYLKPGEIQPEDGVWYDNPAEKLRWKADTSSDEIVGHFFLFSIAFDTLHNAELKRRIAATTARIMDHIISHGYYLIDRTGKPTTWGKWSPEYFQSKSGRSDSPLNAIELLSFLRAARHITGDRKYDVEYEKVARHMGYARIATSYLELAEEINYSDEELAMLSFFTLFRYEHDAQLLPLYRKALDGWWRNISRERNPLWNLIYLYSEPLAAREALVREAAATLQLIPLDLVTWTIDNTYRRDVAWDGSADRFKSRQSTTWLPPSERPMMKWNGNPFRVNGGDGGSSEDDGTFYLLPYWLGRYWSAWSGGE